MSLKTFYLKRFGLIPIIKYKNTSVEQNENTNIIHTYYTLKTKIQLRIHNCQRIRAKLTIKPRSGFKNM